MPDLRLIRAEILKLRRRPGLMAATGVLAFASAVLYFVVLIVVHALDPSRAGAGGAAHFDDAMGILGMAAPVAGVLVGATAGGADIEAGVFRDLAATGRSRTALFAARLPGAWAIVVPPVLAAIATCAVLATVLGGPGGDPTAHDVIAGGAAALAATMLVTAVSVGLAALTGSRGMVIGVVLAFQLGVSPLLAQLEILGAARHAIPAVATARLDGALASEFALGTAIAVIIAWAVVPLAAGLWRTRTQEI
jgi:ABC-type transport system involved in multi-copper enzyme maturation permease subunit